MNTGDLGSVLRGRDFRRLYATRLTSQLTDGVFQIALASYVFFSPEKQTTAGKAAAAFAVLLLPYSLVGPFAGVFIDRWSRRQILVWAPIVRAALVVGVAGLLVAGQDGAPFFLAALLVIGVNRFFLSALSAALPHVVGRELLVMANSLSVTSGTIIAFAGAGLGYLLRKVLGGEQSGTAMILLCTSGLYLLAGLVARTLRRDQLGPDLDRALPQTREALGNVVHGLADGAGHIWRRRPAALALAAISLHRFLYGITMIMAALLFRNYFSTSADTGLDRFALFLGASGAGFLAGAVITPWAVRLIGKNGWIASLLLFAAVIETALGLPFREIPFLVGGFALGLVSQGVKLSVDVIVQETIEDAYRGRVFAVYDMLFNATFVAAAAVAAATVPSTGKSHAVLGVVIAVYACAAVAYRLAARSPAPLTADDGTTERRIAEHGERGDGGA
ncbi:MFS transporter [Actinomadura sp. HBU206391]|uniref:MFS transporter n=1 Tax=Actinomadura sp. HBU206391 TaxID=2731692 RepID=UPI002905A481|nr:MFS transporter [Actinomadura sp. HBU206391]